MINLLSVTVEFFESCVLCCELADRAGRSSTEAFTLYRATGQLIQNETLRPVKKTVFILTEELCGRSVD